MPQAYEAISNHNSTFSSSGVENFTITETFTGLFDHPSYILEVERMSKLDIRDCEYLLSIFANANSEYLIEYIKLLYSLLNFSCVSLIDAFLKKIIITLSQFSSNFNADKSLMIITSNIFN